MRIDDEPWHNHLPIFAAMSTNIRTAAPADIPAIQAIAREVWPVTYGPLLPGGQIDYMLNMMYSTEALSAQMKSGHLFLVAELDGHPAGFASAGMVNDQEIKLHKLYVLSTIHGKGIGRRLFQHICDTGRTLGAALLYLNVNKQNPAYDFYLRMGFRFLGEEVIDIGNGYVMDDYILGYDL